LNIPTQQHDLDHRPRCSWLSRRRQLLRWETSYPTSLDKMNCHRCRTCPTQGATRSTSRMFVRPLHPPSANSSAILASIPLTTPVLNRFPARRPPRQNSPFWKYSVDLHVYSTGRYSDSAEPLVVLVTKALLPQHPECSNEATVRRTV